MNCVEIGCQNQALSEDRYCLRHSDRKSHIELPRHKPARLVPRCVACAIESEIGTEEDPHPVPERFHTCKPINV